MAIDRVGARRRIRVITWSAAAGAAAATAAFAFGAARSEHTTTTGTRGNSRASKPDAGAQTAPQPVDPQAGQGFTPPSQSTSPPQAMSGGS